MKHISQKDLYQGNWLTLVESVYENKHGQQVVWESVKRRKPWVGVVAVARMVPSNRFILVKQFRPAINGYVLGFPAGISDGDPNHALVELKEETGYTGTIKHASPVMKINSGIVNDSGITVYIEVDESLEVNQSPQQMLEPGEDIDVVLVSRTDMKQYLLDEYKKGTHIGGNLWYLFILSEMINET
ncbi:MAG: NUDIX hydrolase [Candidatus Omnitrophica bacterium]|nr:NUDIX hydrolase [Candidatus Omnitrophota bacterium]